jgi:hypothetical protein
MNTIPLEVSAIPLKVLPLLSEPTPLNVETFPPKKFAKKILINRAMTSKRTDLTEEQVKGLAMSPAQCEVFLIIDEYWKRYGCSPSLRNIAFLRGKMGLGNTKGIVDRLVRIGAVKRLEGKGRTIRPVYINFRNLDGCD